MRQFYVLSADPTPSGSLYVFDQELGRFDIRPLLRGERIQDRFPEDVRFIVSGHTPCDLLPDPMGLVIMSDRMWRIVDRFVPPDDVQVHNAPLFDQDTLEPLPGFRIVNCLRSVRAMSPRCAAGRMIVDQLEIEPLRLPEGVHMFRPAECPHLGLVSDELLQALTGKGLFGLIPIRTKSVAG